MTKTKRKNDQPRRRWLIWIVLTSTAMISSTIVILALLGPSVGNVYSNIVVPNQTLSSVNIFSQQLIGGQVGEYSTVYLSTRAAAAVAECPNGRLAGCRAEFVNPDWFVQRVIDNGVFFTEDYGDAIPIEVTYTENISPAVTLCYVFHHVYEPNPDVGYNYAPQKVDRFEVYENASACTATPDGDRIYVFPPES
ncbi:MAG: hypothetical protein AAF125_05255 [Chloroflexota bacterium]